MNTRPASLDASPPSASPGADGPFAHVGLPAGGGFPDLELTDHAGYPRRLSELIAGDPALVHFYRGWWCPKEQAFFRRLIELQHEAEVAYSRFVSISVDSPEVSSAFRAGLGARWTFLCDHERTAISTLGLRETTDTTHDPYVPAAFLLGPDLQIQHAWDGYWFWGRPTAEEVRLAFRSASALVRPDWRAPIGG